MVPHKLEVKGPGGRLAGWTTGPVSADRPPVLFIHPINTQGKIWFDVVERLSPDRKYIMPDLRAHGGSGRDGEFGLAAWLSDCLAVLDDQGIDGPFHVVGGSLGGPLACCVAAARPEQVLSLTAIGSSLNFEGVEVSGVLELFDELGVEGTFRKVFPEMTFGPDCSDDVIEKGIALANPNDTETVKRVWHATITSDATAEARAVRCPSLVLSGEYDATCTPALGLQMARALRTEHTLIPDIGHMPMLECPDRLAQLLGQHLEWSERAAGSGSLVSSSQKEVS